MLLCVYMFVCMYTVMGRLCRFMFRRGCWRGRQGEDAVLRQYDNCVFILFLPLTLHKARDFGACGFCDIIHAERHNIGSVCICGERIYGKRSEKQYVTV